MDETPKKPPVPPVAPERAEELPGTRPKPLVDDPKAVKRIRRIMSHPSYVRADRDLNFLAREDLRSVRLGLEYLKPELALLRAGIRSTIVVFGGTRIAEPAEARRHLHDAREAFERDPTNSELHQRLRVSERIEAKSHYYDVAREFARMVSEACQDDEECEFVVTTGGGPGIMEAANRGAYDLGCKTIGLNIELPREQFPNPYITPGLCFHFRYFALRKFHFVKRAKALVAFPGGYGTFDELFETLCLVQTRKIAPLPVVLVGEAFWRRAFDASFLVEEGVIAPEDAHIFSYAETAREIWDTISAWHARPKNDKSAKDPGRTP
ncbi:MAG: TIGR00730 family Rossman fold protein [Myxococcales bacterium]|nr:TIGR00730 family Rossman fold protein [Myxococcales bacterium]